METKRDYCRLGKKQLAVITDIFENALTEADALEKNHVSKWLYQKWLDNPIFLAELDARFDEALRRSKFLIAHCLPLAVQRLVQLIVSEKEETARRPASTSSRFNCPRNCKTSKILKSRVKKSTRS